MSEKFNMGMPLISICITSYNRINELKRCLLSIDTKYISDIEIIVSEDHSPLKEKISDMVREFSINSKYKVVFNTNDINLGYDRNLEKLISLSNGKYILYISDDDCLIEFAVDGVIEKLREENVGVAFTPFILTQNGITKRNYSMDIRILKGEKSAEKYLYDSILFSGLIFRSEVVRRYSAEKFVNHNYYQVYMFLTTLLHNDGLYIDIPMIECVGDGENAYGIAESSGSNSILANRTSVLSNLEFHKGLIKVISVVDRENGTNIFAAFAKEYSIRTYVGLSTAKKISTECFNEYWKTLKGLDIHLTRKVYIYHMCLQVLGSKLCDNIFGTLKLFLIKARQRA